MRPSRIPRKKYDDEPDNHERWLISYADFITLLFAFFVVMYALSSVNDSKYRVLSDSLLHAFGKVTVTPMLAEGGQVSVPLKAMAPAQRAPAALRREKENLTRIARDILTVLGPLVDQGKVRVMQTDRGVTVEINASVLFTPGKAKLTSESSEALTAVAAVLKDGNHAIQVEGHTDSVPINNALFPSNWELSAVRAGSVVRLFIENGVAEQRLTAIGRGATKPVDTNETAEGRLRNRRVTVMIMSRLPEAVTEVPVEQTTPK
jgi:chemotaxis protein MotB